MRTRFFAVYTGPSMNPALSEPELLEIVPCGNSPVRVGDVVMFLPPQTDQPTVHRVVRMTPAGVATRGDNNSREDAHLLQPENIQGRVVAAWRGRKRRTIAGGWQGRLASRWFRWRCMCDRGVAPLLRPLYRTLSRRGVIVRLLPVPLRPRVVVFRTHGRDQRQLLWGQRLIGRYDDRRRQWRIQRPFHMLAAGANPPGGASRTDRST